MCVCDTKGTERFRLCVCVCVCVCGVRRLRVTLQRTDGKAVVEKEEMEALRRRESKAFRGMETVRVRSLESEEKEAAAELYR